MLSHSLIRGTFTRIAVSGALVVSQVLPAVAGTNPLPAKARQELKRRLAPSEIVLKESWRLGRVQELGSVLVLLQDGVPAKEFRTLSQQKPYPRVWHLDDYARFEIVNGQGTVANPSEKLFTQLSRGELLVILDHKFKGNTIELWTHTLNPVAPSDAPPDHPRRYASTKFVFHFPSEVLSSGDVAKIEADISRWFKAFESEWDARDFARTLQTN